MILFLNLRRFRPYVLIYHMTLSSLREISKQTRVSNHANHVLVDA